MRRQFLALLLGLGVNVVCAQLLQAQTADGASDYNQQFYLFVSRGAVSGVKIGPSVPVAPYGSWQIGGGAEWFIFKGLAVGGELAAAPKEVKSKPVTYTYRDFSGNEVTTTYAANGVKGWGSLNLSYHFKGLPATGWLVPFVTAGGTFFARDGLAEATNYGGGISLWTSRHRGWRLEYRKHVVDEGSFNTRFRSVRVGLILR